MFLFHFEHEKQKKEHSRSIFIRSIQIWNALRLNISRGGDHWRVVGRSVVSQVFATIECPKVVGSNLWYPIGRVVVAVGKASVTIGKALVTIGKALVTIGKALVTTEVLVVTMEVPVDCIDRGVVSIDVPVAFID